jgi:hypothetical protein
MREVLLREDPDWYILHRRGVRRPWVGTDPLEARAVSEAAVRGYLHERVCYKWFTGVALFKPGADFDFQSSQLGGRLELGGMVVDFLFPYLRIAFSLLGPQHLEPQRKAKDVEQAQLLRDMGYFPVSVTTALVRDEYMFNKVMWEHFLSPDRGNVPLNDVISFPRQEDDDVDISWDNLWETVIEGLDVESLID